MSESVTLPQLYTIQEVAEYLGVSVDTVRREYTGSRLGYTRIGGRIKFTEDQITEYLKNQRINPCKKNNTPDRSASTGSPNGGAQTTGAARGTTPILDKRDVHRLAQRTFGKPNSHLRTG